MKSLRALHALDVLVCGTSIGLSLAGCPRAAVIVLAINIFLIIRSLETLRTRPENRK